MNVQANTEEIRHISLHIQEISRELGTVTAELEAVERALERQTEFGTEIRMLRKLEDRVTEERYKTKMMAQALDNIGDLYQRTETQIEDSFESQAPPQSPVHTANVDLSGFYDRVNTVLYGGESGWQR